MSIPLRFQGQSVFVAGGSSGINLGIATAFAKAGANVAIASRNAERVAQAVDVLRGHADVGARMRLSRMGPPILAFAAGAIGGAYAITFVGFWALALPALVLCGVYAQYRDP